MKDNIIKVVLHVSNIDQINRMQNNINNLLKEDDSNVINIVINGEAVRNFTVDNSNIKINTNATYYLCNNSLNSYGIDINKVISGTKITASGVFKLALLQNEGFLYIKV
ncbi:hypothetical protein [Acholeplasma granularum]|uniref:DsrE family protein n=1 Tax=Acholeplasma granularum TaxID=264635 RepID=UPI000470B420|nr:hypothetical protein [Acholeplasma granularum]